MEENTFIPYGKLGIVALESCTELAGRIDSHLVRMNKEHPTNSADTYIIESKESRFSNGEGKIAIEETVRGKDLYIMCDTGNYSCTYEMYGFTNHKSPDDHFQDIKRVLSAISGKARRITVVMPLLYASRQHRKRGRESLDCALALQELESLGVQDIITFDVHDPTVQNAVPMISFDNIYPTYETIKTFMETEKDIAVDKNKMLVISPDSGAMDRAIYYSSVLGLDIGLFYKRRDHSKVVKGKNPIVNHEYIGRDVEGQDILIVDDMISSGESIFDIITELKKRKANKIFVATTFSLFTEGIAKFQKFYDEGLLSKVYSTNLTYVPKEAIESEWYKVVDMSESIANIIYNLNYDKSIRGILRNTENIKSLIEASK
ncbi:ribose-phosphate pyrophosphokinase [Clostridium cellulovorans]|uniref:ribose-phosphate diphosphokinase n=1 Tax=Clostridium cellulovorans (strain ATCC 35296 / DSM 3052 / OCM 3 / 743B) TaxID=573061 RepID=D9SWS1_CLOC7|nr:ribose-phosphate pyrophosphokinase [Clostridium cellulovorans]ADL51282.1 ribose-phosphate pyrophosphokinase [Clostridium cellulovorans 743B]